MREKLITVLIWILLVPLVSVVTAGAEGKPFPKAVAVGSGSVGGGYNMVTMAVSKYWEKELGVTATVAPGVALQNLRRFGEGRLDLVVSPSPWNKSAYRGIEDMGFPEPIKELRIMFQIYPSPNYFIALKSSGLRKISDLKGKRVGCGPNEANWGRIVGDKFEANGLKFFGSDPDIKKVYASWQDMCRMLRDGNLDACASSCEGLGPQPATQELMHDKELVALEWNPDIFEKLKDNLFEPTVAKKELVPFLENDLQCFQGGIGTFVCRDNLDEEFIYALVRTAHQNLEKLAKDAPLHWGYSYKYPDILIGDQGIPYHPGAIRYWKEVGIWK